MDIGLFFGSFNPIHIGHLVIANTMVEHADISQVWFVVSPQNPFKEAKGLAHELDRLHMVRLAIADNPKLNVTDIEFRMPKPSYTVDTLTYLSEKYPQHKFQLIIGEDNLRHFHKWKNHQVIIDNYPLLVYPRPESKPSKVLKPNQFNVVEAPMIDISATFIRKNIQQNRSIKYLVDDDVISFINGKHLYE